MAQDIKTDSDADFRKKNQWYSFTSQAWGSLGMASFFGALSALANGAIWAAAKAFEIGGKDSMMHAMGDVVTNLPTLGVIGGLVMAGLAFSYMSQRDATELRILQDEHMAQQQAKCVAPGKVVEQTKIVEYDQNQRADGKTWQEATHRGQPQVSTRLQ